MLLKKILPILFCLVSVVSFSQNEKVTRYINQYKELAIKEMLRTGVPASITLAQGILESMSGESDLAKRSNNHFGIKCKTDWTGEKVYHNDDERGECFRSYPDPEQSYIDHSDFLKSRSHYAFLFKLDPTDFEGWAKGLKKAGYATNPTYAQKLIDIIQRYDLQEYTLIALRRNMQQGEDMAFVSTPAQKQDNTSSVNDAIDSVKQTEESSVIGVVAMEGEKETSVKNESIIQPAIITSGDAYKASDYPESPFTINGAKVILAKEGTSLLAIANEFGVSYKKLLEFNDMDEAKASDILGFDQLIYLSKKGKKGSKDLHIVEPNETLEIISQKEGVLLEFLHAYNRIPKGRQPMAGEKIYLRANSPVTPKLVESSAKN